MIKAIVGLSLIAILIGSVDTSEMIKSFYRVDFRYLILVIILPHFAILLSTLKWQILLRAFNADFSFKQLFELYLIGTFVSNFLPTMVGGDTYKAYALYKGGGRASEVIAGTFLERFIGLAALLTILPLILLQTEVREEFSVLGWIIAAVVLAYVVLVIILANPRIRFKKVEYDILKTRGLLQRIVDLLSRIHSDVQSILGHNRALLISFTISLLFYLVTVCTTWLAAKSLGLSVDYLFLLATVPAVLLAAFIPISLNGLGITEAGYILVFQIYGVSAESALGVALLLRLRLILTAILGGILFMRTSRNQRSHQQPERKIS
jgi:uncharacterized protein (TIRG00374 family)